MLGAVQAHIIDFRRADDIFHIQRAGAREGHVGLHQYAGHIMAEIVDVQMRHKGS